MKEQQDYTKDIVEIRSMMERSTKFPSLTGWGGIMVGIYALVGAFIAYYVSHFNPDGIIYNANDSEGLPPNINNVVLLAVVILILAISTGIFLADKKVGKSGEKVWNAASRRLLVNLAVPLTAGGIFILILLSKDLLGLLAPATLLFYGIALYSASKFTYDEVKFLGMIQMCLGLFGSYYVEYGMLLWAIGFGVVHIVYGIYMHFKYER